MSWVFQPVRAVAWSLVKATVRRSFPDVKRISTAELAHWLVGELPPPILIDARRTEEYAVSHLPGAHHLPTVAAVQQADIPPEATLVVYCSVGYRSARLVKQLQTAGYRHVMNLEGSIFEWYNQGHPVVVNREPVQQIHPYNRTWGLLLES